MTDDDIEAALNLIGNVEDPAPLMECVKAKRLIFDELNRLRSLINGVKMSGPYEQPMCPWCERFNDNPHRRSCPAFTPEGVLK